MFIYIYICYIYNIDIYIYITYMCKIVQVFFPAAVWIMAINFVKWDRRGVSQQVGLPATSQSPR